MPKTTFVCLFSHRDAQFPKRHGRCLSRDTWGKIGKEPVSPNEEYKTQNEGLAVLGKVKKFRFHRVALEIDMPKPKLTVLLISLPILLLSFGLALPAKADIINCCLCHIAKAETMANLCLNIPAVTSCSQAGMDLYKIYGDPGFTSDCADLDAKKCIVIAGGNTSAQCPFPPATHTDATHTQINKTYLDTALKNTKAQQSSSTNPQANTAIPTETAIKLNIDIPGVSFPTQLYYENQTLFVPYMAIYVSAFQKYLIGIGIVAAAFMLLYGGFIYLISATGAKIQSAKDIIQDALIGLALILGCYVILSNVNPNTTTLGILKVPYVQPDYYTMPTAPMNNTAPGTGPKSNLDDIVAGAKMAHADPCHVLAQCEHETGLRQIWNGWPQNPKENSFMFGACSGWSVILRDGQPFDKKMRDAFPGEWPDLGTDLPIPKGSNPSYTNMPVKAELMINNSKMDGYLAGLELKSTTIQSIADTGIGSDNIARWRAANAGTCTAPAKDLTLAEAAVMGADAAVAQACLPDAAAGGAGCPDDNQNCSPVEPDKINSITKGYKIEPSGTIHGICQSSGKQCFTIWTKDNVKYNIKAYQRYDAIYHCTAAVKK